MHLDGRLLAALALDAAAPPIVVFAFFGEHAVEAPTARLDVTVEAEPQRDRKKSGEEQNDFPAAGGNRDGAGQARERGTVIRVQKPANENRVRERQHGDEQAQQAAHSKEKCVPGLLGIR